MSALHQRTALLVAAWFAISVGVRPNLVYRMKREAKAALLPWPADAKFGADGAQPMELKVGAAISLGDGLTEAVPAVAALRRLLDEVTGGGAQEGGGLGGSGGSIHLLLQGEAAAGSTAEQGYHLNITGEGVVLVAPSPEGLFYGVQTLRQLISQPDGATAAILPPVEISDAPRFVWRGLHLDVSRHFFTATEVKKLLETMSLFKLNRFHWHLTDDQGWRLPVEGYPRLTEVGGQGKAYTTQELKDVVAFAQARHIEVIPEVDVPGHVEAALAAYPDLGNSDVEGWNPPTGPMEEWGISSYTLAPSNATWLLLEKVFDVVAEIFPARVVHIGGDEVRLEEWAESEAARQSVSFLSTEQPAELVPAVHVARLFSRRVVELLEARGRRAAAWDEAQHTGNFPADGIVMAWKSMSEAKIAVDAGRQVVVAASSALYFDWAQASQNEPPSQGHCSSWQSVYNFDPLSGGLEALPAEKQSLVLGAQGQLWSEYLPNWTHVEYMAHPRSLALAEKTWSLREATQDDGEFELRLRARLRDLDRLGVNYRGLGADGCAIHLVRPAAH